MASQDDGEEESRESGNRDFLAAQMEMFRAGFSFSGFERDLIALNRGDGTYLNISGVSGADSVTDGRAAVYADLDNDGDTDIFLRAMHGPAHLLFRNQVGAERRSLRLALEGRSGGRDAFGAVVRVYTAAGVRTKIKAGGTGFLSQGDPRLLFGLDTQDGASRIEVTWPAGNTETYPGAAAGASLLLVEGEGVSSPVQEVRFQLPDSVSLARQALAVDGSGRLAAVPLQAVAGKGAESGLTLDRLAAGGLTLVNFWATWCLPCAREMPELQEIHQRWGESGLRVVGISVDAPAQRHRIDPFLQRLGVDYPIYTVERADLEVVFTRADVPIPLSVLVDGDGRVVDAFEGWSPAIRKRLEAQAAAAPR